MTKKSTAEFFHLIPEMERDYCMSLAVRAGDLLYIGGLTATDGEGNELYADDAGMQMKAVYEKMGRVLEAHGGCATDIVSETDGVRVVVDSESVALVTGAIVDFKDDGLAGAGFAIENPNSSGTCGCGESFS